MRLRLRLRLRLRNARRKNLRCAPVALGGAWLIDRPSHFGMLKGQIIGPSWADQSCSLRFTNRIVMKMDLLEGTRARCENRTGKQGFDQSVPKARTYAGVDGHIGRTPLLRLRRLSELTGCEILGKAEFMNPGG